MFVVIPYWLLSASDQYTAMIYYGVIVVILVSKSEFKDTGQFSLVSNGYNPSG